MSVYLKQIEQLLELQKVDDVIHVVKQELEKAPLELTQLEKRFSDVEEKRNKIVDKIAHIQEQQKRIDFEIESDVLNIKKSKNKLMQVTNQREYHAMMREMDSMEKQNRLREEEKVVLAEELQLQNVALADIDLDYLALKAELDVKREGLQERIDHTKHQIESLYSDRIEIIEDEEKMNKHTYKRYEFIRNRLDHPVIVSVEAGICSGCNIAIPPQDFIEVQRGQKISDCPNCQRLIYWCEHFKEQEKEVPIEAPKKEFKFFKED